MLNGNEDLELEDFSRQGRIFLPASNRPLPSIQEQTSSIETGIKGHAIAFITSLSTCLPLPDCPNPRWPVGLLQTEAWIQ